MREIDDAEAIRAAQRQPGRACGSGDALLGCLPLPSGLREARREYDDTAHAAAGARRDRVFDGGTWNEQHGGVDAFGQVIDGADAGPIPDVRLVSTDEMNGAAVSEVFEIPQRQESGRARLWRDRGRIKREMSIDGAAVTAFRGLQPECFFRRIVPSPGR